MEWMLRIEERTGFPCREVPPGSVLTFRGSEGVPPSPTLSLALCSLLMNELASEVTSVNESHEHKQMAFWDSYLLPFGRALGRFLVLEMFCVLTWELVK